MRPSSMLSKTNAGTRADQISPSVHELRHIENTRSRLATALSAMEVKCMAGLDIYVYGEDIFKGLP